MSGVSSSGTRKLIALDLDQTLFGDDLEMSPRVKLAVERVQEAGVLVTIATGREARLASRFAADLRLGCPIICAQGGCIFDHRAGRVLRDVRLDPGMVPRILEAAARHRWNIHFEMSDKLYFPRESNHPPALFELVRYSNWARVGDLARDMPEPPHKVIVTLIDSADRDRVVSEMQATFDHSLTIVPSHPHLVEGLPPGVDKGRALEWLAREARVPRESVMAIGDSDADLPMLRWAGFGVAMGNAADHVKRQAAWVAPTLQQDGAVAAMERFTGIRV